MRKKKFFFSPSSFQKGKKKGKRNFLEMDEKRGKNQGIEPFSPSSTSSFWERKEREREGNKVEKGKEKTLFETNKV